MMTKTMSVKIGRTTLIYTFLKHRRSDGVVAVLTAYRKNGILHRY